MGAAVATNSAPSLVNFFSRGTSDRSVHRDALSAAALCFEATPLPPRVFVDPAELPLCAALIRGGSISRHPPPTEAFSERQPATEILAKNWGNKQPRYATYQMK